MITERRSLLGVAAALIIILALSPAAYGQGRQGGVDEQDDEFDEVGNGNRPYDPYTAMKTLRSPTDMAIYLVILMGGAWALLGLVARGVKQPIAVTVTPIPESPVSAELSAFLRTNTDKLILLNFANPLDFTVPELPHKGFYRVMFMPRGDHAAFLGEIESQAKKLQKHFVNYVEFQTVLDNGVKILTNNSPMKLPFKPLPHIVTFCYPRIVDAQELFDAHRADVDGVRSVRGGRITPQRREEFKEEFENGWIDVMQYQAAVGLVKKSEDGKSVIGTSSLVWRALSPMPEAMKKDRRGVLVPLMGALLVGLVAWWAPRGVELLGLQRVPFLACEMEAVAILLITLAVGYVVGSGGAMLGVLCYIPTIVVFQAGPIGHLMPTIIALNAGIVGEKLRKRPAKEGLPLYKHLSPEVYIMVLALAFCGERLLPY